MYTALDISNVINGTVIGNDQVIIIDICELSVGRDNCITFMTDRKYKNLLSNTLASVIIVDESFKDISYGKTFIQVENPSLSFIEVSKLFRPVKNWEPNIHKSVIIDNNVDLGENVYIGANVVIESDVKIGQNTYIGHNSIIAHNSIIGGDTIIQGNVSIYHDVKIGNCVNIDSGTVIGADGFGLVSENGNHHRVPHTGDVIVENGVSIGANCCIDRGTINSTIVGEFSRLDNFIQVAHNVVIGKSCVIAGQVGLAGSCILGDFVTIGGQSGIVGHIKIEDNCIIATNSLVTKSLKKGSFVSGIPARDHLDRRKQEAVINQLPQFKKRLKELEIFLKNKD